MTKYKRSPIFYMGNKYKLLKDLIPLFPDSCDIDEVYICNYTKENKTKQISMF